MACLDLVFFAVALADRMELATDSCSRLNDSGVETYNATSVDIVDIFLSR